MSRGRRGGQTPPTNQRRPRMELDTSLDTTGTISAAGATQIGGGSGTGPTRVYFDVAEEVPPAAPRPADGSASKRIAEIIMWSIASFAALGTVFFTASELLHRMSGLEDKMETIDRRMEGLGTTSTRIDVQMQQLQSSMAEVSREVRESANRGDQPSGPTPPSRARREP